MTRVFTFVSLVAVILLGIATPAALAHPLGNFTINHHIGVTVAADGLDIDLVLDFAEIPAFQALRENDTDRDGTWSTQEADAYAASTCIALGSDLRVAVDGDRLGPRLTGRTISFPPGNGGIPTMRLECGYRVDHRATVGTILTVDDESFPTRIGWREIVVRAEGVVISTDLPAGSASAVLTAYPEGPSLDVRSAVVEITALDGGIAAPGDSAMPRSSTVAGPLGVLGSLISSGNLGVGPLAIGLLAALVLGLAHALAPGHGKTLMAAYLVGNQGKLRHAVGLGLAVAVSHTLGVAVLGLVTVLATSAFEPERVYPYLSAASGLIVLTIGIVLAVRTVRRRARVVPRAHDHVHHGEEHHHDDDHHHDHHHPHSHEHDHGPLGHSHPALPEGAIGWKSMVALGLSGGLVPSASAVVLLLSAVSLGRAELGLVLIFFFGIGMATALVGAGLAVVAATKVGVRIVDKSPRLGRLVTWLPVGMACVVTVVGAMMTAGAFRSLLG